MPIKTRDRSEALERISAPVGKRVMIGLGGRVIPEGRCISVGVEIVLLMSGGCIVTPILGSLLLVGPMLEMAASEGVVTVSLKDELTEKLTISEEEIAINLELDEDGTGVKVVTTLSEGYSIVLELATGNRAVVPDADRKLAMDVLEEVAMSPPGPTVDDPPSGSTLLPFTGIGKGAEACAGGLIFSVPLITCAEASKERKSVRAMVWLTKSDIIVSTCSNQREKEGCSETTDLRTVSYSINYSQEHRGNHIDSMLIHGECITPPHGVVVFQWTPSSVITKYGFEAIFSLKHYFPMAQKL
jgi:hypothetical protein